jgi:hypothetical protein
LNIFGLVKAKLRRERPPRVDLPALPGELREFVYLDEVSLRSLLSSQKGEMTEEVSDQVARSREAEIGAALNASVAIVGGAEVTSRFQTSNSSTLQTSRKATVQSWFRELHQRGGIRLIGLPKDVDEFSDEAELARSANGPAAIRAKDLKRGELVEFRAKLTADPVFHMSTMVSEFVGMAKDFPEKMLPDAAKALEEVGPINKLLEKLLAGLIPIRAEALDYVVAKIQGEEHLVHRATAESLDLESRPLVIVGVTEHLAYWKDIRRVLFSDAEFTIMCRIARSELQSSWTPVKLADLFRKAIPDLVTQIDTASRFSLMPGGAARAQRGGQLPTAIQTALANYARALLVETGHDPNKDQLRLLAIEIERAAGLGSTATSQRAAFADIHELIVEWTDAAVTSEKDLELRSSARAEAGLSHLPVEASPSSVIAPQVVFNPTDTEERLLDVEIVAIYW